MYEIHPLLAHIPLGFFLCSGIVALAGFFIDREKIKPLLIILIGGGLIFLIPVIYTGLKAEETAFVNGMVRNVLIDHKRAAYVILVMFLINLLWLIIRYRSLKTKEYSAFVIFMIFSCSTVIYEGMTGNKLVFEHGIHVKEKAPVPQDSPEESFY